MQNWLSKNFRKLEEEFATQSAKKEIPASPKGLQTGLTKKTRELEAEFVTQLAKKESPDYQKVLQNWLTKKTRELEAEFVTQLAKKESPDYQKVLQNWLTKKTRELEAEFVTQLAQKSENNFMYLRYVIPTLAEGYYDNLSLQQLPQGLQEYYQTHWQRMGMEKAGQKLMVIILFILVEMQTPPTKEMITAIADCDEYEAEKILDEQWVEYIKQQVMEGETCYSIYHASFRQFLSKQRELKKTRKLFQEVNERITQFLYGC